MIGVAVLMAAYRCQDERTMKQRSSSLKNAGGRATTLVSFPQASFRVREPENPIMCMMFMVLLGLVLHTPVVSAVDWRISGYSPSSTHQNTNVEINGMFSSDRSRHHVIYGTARAPAAVRWSANRMEVRSSNAAASTFIYRIVSRMLACTSRRMRWILARPERIRC
jgi:hypothetical protein